MKRFVFLLTLMTVLAWIPGELVAQTPTKGNQSEMAPPPGSVVAIPTHRQFAESFKPVPGKHRVTLIHPYTCCPVDVCFDLPCECVKCVKADCNEITIRYGLIRKVEIRFYKDGGVKVKYCCV